MRPRWVALFPTLALSCFASGPREPAIVDGGVCAGGSVCLDGAHYSCPEREWVTQSCDEFCAEVGLSAGDGDCLGEACACGAPIEECTLEAGPICVDVETLAGCSPDGEVVEVPCPEICLMRDPPALSDGCVAEDDTGAACACTLVGTACGEQDLQRCESESTIARCIEGLWEVETCQDICGDPDAPCTSFGETGPDCDCG